MPVYIEMWMRHFFVLGIFVLHSAGTTPEITVIPRRASKGDRDPLLKQRDAIVESVFLPHPEWTSERVHIAAKPLIEAAGLPPMTIRSLRAVLSDIAKKHQLKRAWGGMHPKHTAYLRDQLAKNPSQNPGSVWDDFQTMWGPDAEDGARVRSWWRDNVRYGRRKRVWATPAPKSPVGAGADSPSDPDLPPDWWNLGDEINQYLTLDELNAETPTPAPAAEVAAKHRSVWRGSPSELKRRNAIVESVILANPTWGSTKIYEAAIPQIVAAGFDPIGASHMRTLVGRMKKARKMQLTEGGVDSVPTAFLKAEFAKDPNPLASEILAKFREKFGPSPDDAARIASWWYHSRHRSRKKQLKSAAAGTRTRSPRAPSPSNTIYAGSTRCPSRVDVPRAGTPIPATPPYVRPSTPEQSDSPPLIPLNWWDIDAVLEQVDGPGLPVDPWADPRQNHPKS